MLSNASDPGSSSKSLTRNVMNVHKSVPNITPTTPVNANATRSNTSRSPTDASYRQLKPQPSPLPQLTSQPPVPQQYPDSTQQQPPQSPLAPLSAETDEPPTNLIGSQDEYDTGYDDEWFASIDLEVLENTGSGTQIGSSKRVGGVCVVKEDVMVPVGREKQTEALPAPTLQQQQKQQQKSHSLQAALTVEKDEPPKDLIGSQDEYDIGYDDESFPSIDLNVLDNAGSGTQIGSGERVDGVGVMKEDVMMLVGRAQQQHRVATPSQPRPPRPPQQQVQHGPPLRKTRQEILDEYERERLANLQHQKSQQQASFSTRTIAVGAPLSPTMGGFNFPPNVNLDEAGEGASLQVGASTSRSNSSGIGLKRTFDSVQ